MSKPKVLSGIQPTSIPHLGNYLGALRNWQKMQEDYECYFMLVDLHALTIKPDPKVLYNNTLESIAYLLGCGLDPAKSVVFLQSHVPQHAELGWVMTCFAHMGELNRMTQYKDKAQKYTKDIPAGLFAYPTLMAADILLYQTQFVPVGQDQKQHLELARNLAARFNNRCDRQIFKVPEPLIQAAGAKIMDLQNPEAKMSKSAENPKGVIFLNESDKDIEKKIKSSTTDSGSEIRDLANLSPGLKNLFEIQICFTGKSLEETFASYEGKQYGYLKKDTAEIAVAALRPIREKAQAMLADPTELMSMLRASALKAREVAANTVKQAYEALGLVPF